MIVFLMGVLVFLVSLSYAVEAKETIDLQKYVSCSLTECQLSVDINELALSSEGKTFLKNIKQGDLNAAVSGLPSSLSDFTVTVKDKEKLIVTAEIEPASQNYWYMEFSNFILDPWFNSSYPHCNDIIVTNGAAGHPSFFNMTYNSNMTNTVFKGLFFVNNTCGETGTEMSFFKRGYSDSNWATFDILLDGTQNISVYYGNATDESEYGSLYEVWGDNIVAYYTFDECTGPAVTDLAYGNNGVFYNATWNSTTKKFGCAGHFTGSNWVSVSDNPILDLSQITIELWAYKIGINDPELVCKRGSTTNWQFFIGSTDHTKLGFYNGTSAWYTTDSITLATLEYMATTLDGSGKNIMYNQGNMDNFTGKSLGAVNNDPMIMGSWQPAGSFVGVIDEVRVYNTSLDPKIVNSLHYVAVEPTLTLGGGYYDGTWEGGETPVFTGNTTVIWDIANLEPNEIYCLGNNTLTKVYFDINITRNIMCINGCDNVTMDCIPPVYQQNIYILFSFAAVMIIAVWLLRRK